MQASETTLRGRVERLFDNSSIHFSAGVLVSVDGMRRRFVGPIKVCVHDQVVFTGQSTKHPKYGWQFQVAGFTHDMDLDAAGLERYLANHPDIKGIGPVRAQRIASAFGTKFGEALVLAPDCVAEVAGVPVETIVALAQLWESNRQFNETATWLASYKLTHHEIQMLLERFGNSVVGILKEDPYALIDEVASFGFKRVDDIARKMGVPKNSVARVRAGLLACVERDLGGGDCWTFEGDLIRSADEALALDDLDAHRRVKVALDMLVSEDKLARVQIGQRAIIARPEIRDQEHALAEIFLCSDIPNPHRAGTIPRVPDYALGLNAGQRSALDTVARHGLVLVTGPGGTGKSHLVSAICQLYNALGLHVELAAPTGKAARRLEQVVGRPGRTLHRLLGLGRKRANGEDAFRDQAGFVAADVVVVDEVSMVDVPLAWHLFKAIDLSRTAVVLVGDHNQLPPVGPGNILRDLVKKRPIPTVVLDEVVRQAGILKENSMAVLDGEVRPTAKTAAGVRPSWIVCSDFSPRQALSPEEHAHEVQDFIVDLYERRLVERLGFDLVRDVQLLTPQYKGPLGVLALNIALQRTVHGKLFGVVVPPCPEGQRPKLLVNDRVIQTRNDYDTGVMNGTLGTITAMDEKRLTVTFEDEKVVEYSANNPRSVDLAWALSAHRAQGSEFACAVVVAHRSHAMMHDRNLLYTAVSRAKQCTVIVGDKWGLRNYASQQKAAARRTFLSLVDFSSCHADQGEHVAAL